MTVRQQTSSLAIRSIQFNLFRAIHSAVRAEIKKTVGSLKGTTTIRSKTMFNLYEREYALKIRTNIARAVTHLHRALREQVNRPWPPASKPGEPPRKRSGRGQAAISRGRIVSVNSDFTQLVYLKPSGFYMALLDAGFNANLFGSGRLVYVPPRPWIEVTFQQELPTLERILRQGF